jgi:predicted kinase
MEAVLLVGLQGAGKTTFFHQYFAATHVRISRDELKTRSRELAALRKAMEVRKDIVIDNTNPTTADRKRYLDTLQSAGWRTLCYYFEPDIAGSIKRNALRAGKERIPVVGLFATRKRMQAPSLSEGFDGLFVVRTRDNGGFDVSPWEPDKARLTGPSGSPLT